jgi:hypothetical protein
VIGRVRLSWPSGRLIGARGHCVRFCVLEMQEDGSPGSANAAVSGKYEKIIEDVLRDLAVILLSQIYDHISSTH